jgi:hypothetical protein
MISPMRYRRFNRCTIHLRNGAMPTSKCPTIGHMTSTILGSKEFTCFKDINQCRLDNVKGNEEIIRTW